MMCINAQALLQVLCQPSAPGQTLLGTKVERHG